MADKKKVRARLHVCRQCDRLPSTRCLWHHSGGAHAFSAPAALAHICTL